MFDIQSPPTPLRTAAQRSEVPAAAPKQTTSVALFEGARELRIDHHGQEYRLRQTRNGKLILTK
jgi:hemin uptake protein HemP